MKFLLRIFVLLFVFFASLDAKAIELSQNTDKVDVSLISNFEAINPHQNIEFLIRFKMKGGWHIFAQNPGEIGMPTTVEWNFPLGYKILE